MISVLSTPPGAAVVGSPPRNILKPTLANAAPLSDPVPVPAKVYSTVVAWDAPATIRANTRVAAAARVFITVPALAAGVAARQQAPCDHGSQGDSRTGR